MDIVGAVQPRSAHELQPEPRQLMAPDAILRVCRALTREYGNPRLGNKSNPLDELVYIILSTRTQDQAFRLTFTKLKTQFPSWGRVRIRDRGRVERILRPAGLSRLKARQLLAIFERLRSSFGRATLAPMRRLPNRQAEAFLTSLPGVAAKVAKCVLMYSFGRQVLPVDVHVHRVATRLGLETKKRPDTSQDLIEGAIPPRLRYGFHVNAVAHGRTVCLPRAPRCDVCCIAKWCHYYRVRIAKAS
jgi:endonuclease III